MTLLRYLRLDHNKIGDITDLAGLTEIIRLDLDNNQIENITPLTSFNHTQSLDLKGNPIQDMATIHRLRKQVPNLNGIYQKNHK